MDYQCYVNLEIESATSAFRIWEPGFSTSKSRGTFRQISFDVFCSENREINLSTGHIFRHPKMHKSRKTQQKAIPANLGLYALEESELEETDDPRFRGHLNELSYCGSTDENLDTSARLQFKYWTTKERFDSVYSQIVEGRFPNIDLTLDGSFTFGNTSEYDWDIKNARHVKIHGIEFRYSHTRKIEEVIKNKFF